MLQVYCRNIKVTIAQRGERDRRGKGRTSCVASIRDAVCLASKSPEPPPARTSGRPHPAAPVILFRTSPMTWITISRLLDKWAIILDPSNYTHIHTRDEDR